MVLVDSSIWIEGFRRDGELAVKVALDGLLDAYEAMWCGPVKLEVLGGARREERGKLEFFFDCIPYGAITDAAWDDAKKLAWHMRDRGHTIPWNDILIASLARSWNVRVYAKDQHYEILGREAGVLLYRPGYGGSYAAE